jgi:two-component system, sensor histidine kinase and response regulator
MASGESMGPENAPELARLLIVDDEAAHVKALCDVLRAHAYATVGCTSAQQALAALSTGSHDLLIADLQMPGMDGIGLLQRAQGIDPDLACIIMTGQGTIETAIEAMRCGAQDYVLKPLRLNVLLSVVSRALATRRLRLENRELIRTLSERTRELEVSNSELEAFTHSVTHDLRGPLTAVYGFAEALDTDLAEQLPLEARELVSDILLGAKRMATVIDDLLRLSMLSRQPLARSEVDMRALVVEVVQQLQRGDLCRASISIGALPMARADGSLVSHVLTNLISNALKFSRVRQDPEITIGSESIDGSTAYFVRDNGVGFSMQRAERLFGAFQRLHSREMFEGTGVGLSIVKRIVERHGGRIWAVAEVEKGATFSFTLGSE